MTLDDFMTRRVTILANGCWECSGASTNGYRKVRLGGRVDPRDVRAHRWVYEQVRGAIPEGLEIDHLCRNRACVNPDHLEPVTHDENMRRTRAEFCKRGHRLVPENLVPNGRSCKLCNRIHARASEQRRRAAASGVPIVMEATL